MSYFHSADLNKNYLEEAIMHHPFFILSLFVLVLFYGTLLIYLVSRICKFIKKWL
jgi:hypothetical protein